MCVTFESRIVKTRKPHRCEWDGEVIEVGASAHYYSGIFEGDFQSYWMHPECWDAFLEYGSDYGGSCWEFEPFAHERGKVEVA